MRVRGKYATDLTDAQWRLIRRFVPPPCKRGAKRSVARRLIIDAILYVVRGGVAWRQLPHDFPNWSTVYGVFWKWRNEGVWQRIHDKLRARLRRAAGKRAKPSAAIIDSQTVKTTDVGGERGYDGGKKTTGRKRHLAVDTLGLILTVVVHTAGLQDHDGACFVFSQLQERFRRLKVVFGDAAYGRNDLPAWTKRKFGWILQTVLRPAEAAGFVVLPKRWIVERTFAWLGKYRRHSKDYERTVESSEAMIYIAMINLMSKRLARVNT